MKLRKAIVILAILGATSMFAVDTTSVNTLVEQINTTKDLELKNELLEKLKTELSLMNKEDFVKAQKIVNENLKVSDLYKK